MKKRITITVITAAILAVIFCQPVMAENEGTGTSSLPEATTTSIGVGPQWAGIGVNYTSVGEGSNFGFTIGAGYMTELGVNGGVVYRFSKKTGIFATYGIAGMTQWQTSSGEVIDEESEYGWSLMVGNVGTDPGQFLWRVGVSAPDNEILFDLGLGWTF